MTKMKRLISLFALVIGLSWIAPAGAGSLSYSLGVTDLGAPTAFQFSFATPIAPLFGLVSFEATISGTLTNASGPLISAAPISPATSIFRFSIDSTEVFADPLGTIFSSFGPITYTGSYDCGVVGCSLLQASAGFLASGDNDQYSLAASWTVTEGVPGEIPEPATLGLLTLALAGLGWSRRRRQ